MYDTMVINIDMIGVDMDKFIIEQSDENIMPLGGLPLAGYLLEITNLENRFNKVPIKGLKNTTKLENFEVMTSYSGLLLQGKNDFQNIEEYRGDIFFSEALGINKVPSASRLRQRLDMMPIIMTEIIKEESCKLLNKNKVKLGTCIDEFIPLDIDVSPFDNSNSQKEEIGYTYKKFMGYAPIFAYVGQDEGYLVNLELRNGKQHCQKNTPEFLKKVFSIQKRLPNLLFVYAWIQVMIHQII